MSEPCDVIRVCHGTVITEQCNMYIINVINLNPLVTGAAYIRFFIFYEHIKYHILNMLKIKCDINQQDLKRVDLHFVKSG